MKSAHRLYRLQLVLGVLGLGLVSLAAYGAFAGESVSLPSPGAVARACDNWLGAGGPAALLGLAIALVALTAIALGARSTLRQAGAARRYLRSVPLAGSVDVDGRRCKLVEISEPQAFCAGLIFPRIYVSRGALRELTRAELRAVVAHEDHHRRRHDPLRLLLARAIADSLFFIPLLRRISERYAALGELAADEAAVRTSGARGPLAAALLKFSGPSLGAVPVASIAPERVDHLLGDPVASRWQLPGSALRRSAMALAALAGGVLLLWHGVLDPTLDPPLMLAAACMTLMVGAPLVALVAALLVSKRFLMERRA